MSLLRVASLAVWLLFSATTWAQAQSSFSQHGYTVHYNAIPSVMLTPEVARSYGLTRSAQRAVLNIAVRTAGDAATAHSVSADVQAVAISSADNQLGDDARGPHLVVDEGIDGKFWTARVGRLEDLRGLAGVERSAIVQLDRATPEMRASDRTIWEIAEKNGLTYSAELHRDMRPGDRDTYITMHDRRLEALRRDGIVTRDAGGTFHLPDDYLSRVATREGLGGRESARVTLLDPHSLERRADYRGPTWLDRMADGIEDRSQFCQEGFGKDVSQAWKQRETTLEKLGLGENLQP